MSEIGECVRSFFSRPARMMATCVSVCFLSGVGSVGTADSLVTELARENETARQNELAREAEAGHSGDGQSDGPTSAAPQREGRLDLGPSCITAMAYSFKDDLIYAVDGSCDGLIIIDELTRLRIHVGPLGFPAVCGLTFDREGQLFAVEGQGDQLLKVDRKTGKATRIGSLGFASVQSLACDRFSRLYGVDTATDQLVSIDKYTGNATAVAHVNVPSLFSLAFVEGKGLYGVDIASGRLYRIDANTGDCSPLTATRDRCRETHGLTAGRDGRLLAYAARGDVLFELNPVHGATVSELEIRQQSVSRFVTQAIPDALPTRILFGVSLVAILAAACIQCGRLGFHYAIEVWQQTRGVFAHQRAHG